MTCIVGMEIPGAVHLGGDSALVDADTGALRVIADPKVFTKNEMIIGCSDNVRIMQLIGHVFQRPVAKPGCDELEYMVGPFVNALRKMLKANDVLDASSNMSAQLLVGFRTRLYCVENDFQAYRIANGYAAVGAGSDIALGSLYSTQETNPQLGPRPLYRIIQALKAAACFNAWVREPFHTVSLRTRGEKDDQQP